MMGNREHPLRLLGEVIEDVQFSRGGSRADIHPRVGIILSQAGMWICGSHLPAIAELITQEINAQGGCGLIVPTAAPCDGMYFVHGQGGCLPQSLEHIVSNVQDAVLGNRLDALIFLSSCDTTVPAHIIAAARANIPTLILAGGYQSPGVYRGRRTDLMEVYEAFGATITGKLSEDELRSMARHCVSGPGVCPGVGTASTMQMAIEALGLATLGNSPVAGGSERLQTQARAVARKIFDVVEQGMTPRHLISADALTDAVSLILGIGGAPSSIGFLQRLADELSLKDTDGSALDVRTLADRAGEKVRQICFVNPAGDRTMEEFEAEGGAAQVMKRLAPVLALDRPDAVGSTLRSGIEALSCTGAGFFRDLVDEHNDADPGLVIMRGNLAPGGGIARPAASFMAPRRFVGTAMLMRNASDAYKALAEGGIRAGTVIVIRGAGVEDFACALHGAGLSGDVAVISDGGYSGLSRGLVVGFILPSAADGGPLSAVADGDSIAIDLDKRVVERLE